MGTLVRLVVYAADQAPASAAARAAFDRVAELDAALSDYRDASEVSRLARAAGGPPVPVGPDLFAVLDRAQEVARRSGGAFDVTVGPLVRLWRRTLRTGDWPDPDRRTEALSCVGTDKMHLEPAARTVRLDRAGMRIDLGGIAKGYAGDQALRVLRALEVSSALVAVGGDVVAGEAPPGEAGWVVEIQPEEPTRAGERLLLRQAAVSTSGAADGDRPHWPAPGHGGRAGGRHRRQPRDRGLRARAGGGGGARRGHAGSSGDRPLGRRDARLPRLVGPSPGPLRAPTTCGR
ncbi:MAG: hypothetical protein DMF79_06585 [Acidobacteria bacterium]|nr:MAG: hypothetical protein DMF79_06585 [Acidobacteriota bacterium]